MATTSDQSENKSVHPVSTGAVHHLALTVSEVDRAQAFYTEVLGFELAMMLGQRALLSNGSIILALTPPPDPDRAIPDDRFDENRIGLDHLSFTVQDRNTLEDAALRLDERGIPRGEIKDLGADLGIYVLAFRDPDNIQIELTAPYGG